MSAKFFTIRFHLDTPTNRFTNKGGDHFVGPFRSFWVSDTNGTPVCDLVINPTDDRGRGIPLRLNQCQAIGTGEHDKAEGACLEWTTAQAGVWIDITFAQYDVIQVGSVVVETSGSVSLNEGTTSPQSLVTVTTAISEIIPANADRKVATMQWKSGGGIMYVGTPTELALANYKKVCEEVDPMNGYRHVGPEAKYARMDAGTNEYNLKQGI